MLAAVQSNPTLGDIGGNVEALLRAREQALRVAPKLELAVSSELALCGYQPDDLLLEEAFLDACEAGIETLQRAIDADGCASLLLGAPRRARSKPLETQTRQPSALRTLFNSAVLLAPEAAPRWLDKSILPNYGVFDEKRYFSASESTRSSLLFKGLRLGVMVCEDMWQPRVAVELARSEAELFLVLNASPFERGKQLRRIEAARKHVERYGVPLLYVNQVGGQDELLFDGGSFALNANEEPVRMPFFEEAVEVFCFRNGQLTPKDNNKSNNKNNNKPSSFAPSSEALSWQGITMGIRDYARKNDFSKLVLGLSGGIDSAVCAVLACEAVGAERVRALFLPSPYTSAASGEDARSLAEHLGIALVELPIEETMRCVARSFETALGEACEGVVFENIQARLRALFLMAYANRNGALLLATSNKSECATGYTTLYGDMGGGYAPLKDAYKTEVYALARWRNSHSSGSVIPERILTKAPSAELRFEQRDEDALAPYEQLDALLRQLIEGEGHGSVDATLRRRVAGLLRRSEHKRFQSPPGPKLGRRAFGRDRRYPIVNRFRPEEAEESQENNPESSREKNSEGEDR